MFFSRGDLPSARIGAPGHVRQGLVSGVWAFGLQWRNAQEIAAAFPALAKVTAMGDSYVGPQVTMGLHPKMVQF